MRSSKKNQDSIFIYFVILVMFVIFVVVATFMHVIETFQQSDPKLYEIREKLRLLSPKVDSLRFYSDSKSYTINKHKIYLCLKDENQEYYSINMLMYVAIHELAHVLCDEIGHTEKFHEIFSQLLNQANELGIYDKTQPIIQNYCGYDKEKFVLFVDH